MTRVFKGSQAVREMTPLMVGIAGPSGCGKTVSALRLATGIQRVVGGKIWGIDTEAGRMKHYAPQKGEAANPKEFIFDFQHVPFGPPFRSLDYLEAIRYCAAQGASVIVIDSTSHEHDGSGGYLEFHAAEEERMSGNAAAKFAAWQRPSKQRNDLIQGLLQLPISFVFCFRAKEKLKPGKEKAANGQEKSVMRELGWMPIGGQSFLYEMTACCLLTPGCCGVPSWNVSEFSDEQQLWIKKPKQFEKLLKDKQQLSEGIGEAMALWSNGGERPSEGWHEQQAKAASTAVSDSRGPQPQTGPDASEPCPVCKSNIPRCKACDIDLIFQPSGFKYRSQEVHAAFWRCPRKCMDPKDKRRNTNINAADWHAILNGERTARQPQNPDAEPPEAAA